MTSAPAEAQPEREAQPDKQSQPAIRAALFDMDRTLVRKNTPQLYTRYQRDIGEVGWAQSLRVTWWIVKYTLGLADTLTIARTVLGDYRGTNEAGHLERCREFYKKYVTPHVTARGKQLVAEYRERGVMTAIVTGSTRYVAEPLREDLQMDHLVCTRVDVDAGGAFTGEVIEPLCFYEGKLELTRALLVAQGISLDEVIFYSDSITDLPLLEAAGRAVIVNPDPRLRREALKRGWPIETW